MRENRLVTTLICTLLMVMMIAASRRGLTLGKWVQNFGGAFLLITFATLILLPFITAGRGTLANYHPFSTSLPELKTYNINVFSKLAVGALSGFEYIAILAGECRAPARNISRSVMISAPIIALMFILGTASVLAFVHPDQVDLIGPIPQVLSLAFQFVWLGVNAGVAHHFWHRGAADRLDEYLLRRQHALADGGRLGQPAAGMVRALARTLSHTG